MKKWVWFFCATLMLLTQLLSCAHSKTLKSQVLVSCRVTRGKPGVTFQAGSGISMFRSSSVSDAHSIYVGSIKINCPENEHVDVSYDLGLFSEKNGLHEITMPKFQNKIYTNVECTEIWDPNKIKQFANKEDGQKAQALFCKTTSKEVSPEQGECIPVLTISINY